MLRIHTLKSLPFLSCLAALLLAPVSGFAGNEIIPVRTWTSQPGAPEFTVFINSCTGSPLNYNPKDPFLTELTMIRNSGGFVTVQGKITNPAPWRKTFRIGWEWRGGNSLVSTAPSDAALAMISLAGHEQRYIQGTSTMPNPASVILTFYQHAK